MTRFSNATERLATFRELQSCVQKASNDGYIVADDTVKLYLLRKAEETKVPLLFQKLWTLQYGSELPVPGDEELLQSKLVLELFSLPKKKPR